MSYPARVERAAEWRIEPEHWDAAIADVNGPQLVVAGPGTGKTEFLVRRALHLVRSGAAEPGELLVLTFSRRAAADLRRRIEEGLTRSAAPVPASTFHSLAYRLLETYAADGHQMPALLTGPEQVELVAELLAAEETTSWPPSSRHLLGTRTFAEEVADFLLRAQEHLLEPADLRRRSADHEGWSRLPEFVERYQHELEVRNRIDYGALQARAVAKLADPEVAAAVGDRHRYVLVDEYQDTTPAQARLLDLITAAHRNLTVAADPYQSVYSFRGAELRNVERFPETFRAADGHPARRLVLTRSFRVPADILDAALRVTDPGVLPGAAGPVTPAPHPGRATAHVFHQQTAEAEWIAAETQRLHLEEGLSYREMAVLVRTKRRFLAELSRALDRRAVPHDPPDGRLVDHPAVRIVLDCVQACLPHPETDSAETDLAVRRLLLGPLFALPLSVERDLLRVRRTGGGSWAELLQGQVEGGDALAALIADPSWATERSAADGFWHLWASLPQLAAAVLGPARADHRAALSSLSQTLDRQAERDSTLTLLDYLHTAQAEDFEATPLLGYRPRHQDRLTLTTLHQAKGLEFEVVFIADAVEGVFPDLRRLRTLLEPRLLSPHQSAEPAAAARFRLQEEMRLAYTAITRARKMVVMTATEAGIDEGEYRPSRFLAAMAGVARTDQLGPPPAGEGRPVTYLEAEAHLRRVLVDPAQASGRRLAAAQLLARRPNPGLRPVTSFAMVRPRGPDQGLLPDELTLSPSQAESYERCPRLYAFEKRLGVGDPPSHYLTFGSVIHAVLESCERAAMERRDHHARIDEALTALDDLWPLLDFGDGAHQQAWHRRAQQLLATLYSNWLRPGARPVALEHPVELELGGVRWRGRIDRVEEIEPGRLRVVDYKTSKTPPTKADAKASLQLGFYLLAARRDPDLAGLGDPVEAELWYPLLGRLFPFDPAELDGIEARLNTAAESILAERWEPRVGKDCQRCPVRLVCPMWPDGREAYAR